MTRLNSKSIWRAAYAAFPKWLPKSQHSVIAKQLRVFFARRFIKYGGININIERGATFGSELSLGDNSSVGIDCEILGPCSIGKDLMMGPEVVVYTRNHMYKDPDTPMRLQGYEGWRPVTIYDDVWPGRRVMIVPGVTIGKGTIVAAGAIVTKDLPEYSIYAGIPAKVIGYRR